MRLKQLKKKTFRVVLRDIENSVYCLPFENSMMFQVSQLNFYQSLLFYQRKAIKSSCVLTSLCFVGNGPRWLCLWCSQYTCCILMKRDHPVTDVLLPVVRAAVKACVRRVPPPFCCTSLISGRRKPYFGLSVSSVLPRRHYSSSPRFPLLRCNRQIKKPKIPANQEERRPSLTLTPSCLQHSPASFLLFFPAYCSFPPLIFFFLVWSHFKKPPIWLNSPSWFLFAFLVLFCWMF